jgi:hypothetical protein
MFGRPIGEAAGPKGLKGGPTARLDARNPALYTSGQLSTINELLG